MNEIINNFSLTGDKFMSEIHLRQCGFTYSACEGFAKTEERIQTFKKRRFKIYLSKRTR